jgi:hypothetical protein
MNEILDLLPIPEERDFPAGQLEARRAALVAAIRVDEPLARRAMRAARGGLARTWLSLLGILALSGAMLMLGFSSQQRPTQREAVTILAVAATAQLAIAVTPCAGCAVAE